MSISRHTHSPREIGFFVEAALSPLSVSSVEWSDNGGNVEIYTTDDPLRTLRDINNWTKFDKPGASGTFDAPAGTRKVAIEATSVDANDQPSVTVVSDGRTNMEQARLYGVDQLDYPGKRPPPFFENVQHWFDFDDADTMFADTAGLIPITSGDEILRINNKGSDGQPLISTDPVNNNHNPFYLPFAINGRGVADGPVGANTPDLGVGNPDWLSSGNAAGIAMFCVTRKVDPNLAFLSNVDWTSQLVSGRIGQQSSTTWRANYEGSNTDTLKTIVNEEWTWHYLTAGPSAGGTLRVRTSGAAEVATSPVYTAIGATGGPFNIAAIKGQTAEAYIYDRELTPAELLVNIDRFDAEYGVMPF